MCSSNRVILGVIVVNFYVRGSTKTKLTNKYKQKKLQHPVIKIYCFFQTVIRDFLNVVNYTFRVHPFGQLKVNFFFLTNVVFSFTIDIISPE